MEAKRSARRRRGAIRPQQPNTNIVLQPLRCSRGCGEILGNKCEEKIHAKMVHDGLGNCPFPGCPRSFSTPTLLARHYDNHYPDLLSPRPSQYPCPVCHAPFDDDTPRMNHFMEDHNDVFTEHYTYIWPHQSAHADHWDCTKVEFDSLDALLEHFDIPSLGRPLFPLCCPACNETFGSNKHRKDHFVAEHSDLYKQRLNHYECEEQPCSLKPHPHKYYERWDLLRHYCGSHGPKRYRCIHPGCKARFPRNDNRMAHMRACHGWPQEPGTTGPQSHTSSLASGASTGVHSVQRPTFLDSGHFTETCSLPSVDMPQQLYPYIPMTTPSAPQLNSSAIDVLSSIGEDPVDTETAIPDNELDIPVSRNSISNDPQLYAFLGARFESGAPVQDQGAESSTPALVDPDEIQLAAGCNYACQEGITAMRNYTSQSNDAEANASERQRIGYERAVDALRYFSRLSIDGSSQLGR